MWGVEDTMYSKTIKYKQVLKQVTVFYAPKQKEVTSSFSAMVQQELQRLTMPTRCNFIEKIEYTKAL